MFTRDHVEELIRNSKSSYFFRHSCATEQDKQELAQKIMDELIIPLSEIARTRTTELLTRVTKYDGVIVAGPSDPLHFRETQNDLHEDYL